MAFTPPPYPHDRLHGLRERADAVPGGVIDASVGTPVDPIPDLVLDALAAAGPDSSGYPPSVGIPELRDAASDWMHRRLGVTCAAAHVVACIGTKEVVASLPRVLSLRDPSRDTVLVPGVAYPTYAMGATLAGLRAVSVPLDGARPLLEAVDAADAQRALVLWLNSPANPTGASMDAAELAETVEWARARGIVVASDECYVEFTEGHDPASALAAGAEGVLAVHSLSKRSNMAGLRAGFVAGDPTLVGYLGEVRKHAGMMMPRPIQAAAAAALGEDDHVAVQRERYARRRTAVSGALEAIGLRHDGGDSTFYLWLRPEGDAASGGAGDGDGNGDGGWAIAERLAERGLLVAPGDFYGDDTHARLSLTLTDDDVAATVDRLTR